MMRPLFAIECPAMRNPAYQLEVWPFAYGQFRIQLQRPGNPPVVLRELCTYDADTASVIVAKIGSARNPEDVCRALERPWNCEGPGQRIRLDNRPEDRPETLRT